MNHVANPAPTRAANAQQPMRDRRGSSALRWLTLGVAGSLVAGGLGGMVSSGVSLLRPTGELPPPYEPFTAPFPTQGVPQALIRPPNRVAPRLDLAQAGAWTHADNCPLTETIEPCAVYTPHAPVAPEPLAGILDKRVWRNCRVSACGGYNSVYHHGPVTLAYTFDHMPDDAVQFFLGKSGIGPHATEAREVIKAALADMSTYANVQFVEAEAPTSANVYFLRLDKNLVDKAGQARGPHRNISWAAATPQYELSYELQAHEAAHAVGMLRDAHEPGPTDVKLPVGPWKDRRFHTLMTSDGAVTLNGRARRMRLRLGPLDLAALAFNYGLPPLLVGDTTHTLDAAFGRAGIHDDDGINTLKAVSEQRVHLDLRTDGQPSCVDNAVARLSPTSQFQTGDISQTAGGVIVGNAYHNIFVGSAGDDEFWTGPDYTYVQPGTGRDRIVVHPDTNMLVVDNFQPERVELAFSFPIYNVTFVEGPAYGRARVNDKLDVYLQGATQWPEISVTLGHPATRPPSCRDALEAEEGSLWRTPLSLLLTSSAAVRGGMVVWELRKARLNGWFLARTAFEAAIVACLVRNAGSIF